MGRELAPRGSRPKMLAAGKNRSGSVLPKEKPAQSQLKSDRISFQSG
jgi:hypothetical protein